MSEQPSDPTRNEPPGASPEPTGVGDRLASWSRVLVERTRELAEEGARRGRSLAGDARDRQEAFRLRRERDRCYHDIGALVAERPAGEAAAALKQESPRAATLLERIATIEARITELDTPGSSGSA